MKYFIYLLQLHTVLLKIFISNYVEFNRLLLWNLEFNVLQILGIFCCL